MTAIPTQLRNRLADILRAIGISLLVWLAAGAVGAINPPIVMMPNGQILATDRWLMFGVTLRGTTTWLWLGAIVSLATMLVMRARIHPAARIGLHAALAVATMAAVIGSRANQVMVPVSDGIIDGTAGMSGGTTPSPGAIPISVRPVPSARLGMVQGQLTGPIDKREPLIYAALVALAVLAEMMRRQGAQRRAAELAEHRTMELQSQLSRAKLDTLRMQLQPHFLYNSLNMIAGLVDIDPPAAKDTIARLGGLLRETLRVSESSVPLAREVEWIESYLEIQERRFGQRLEVELRIAPETLGCDVPFLILQPLVENALQHGVASLPPEAIGRIVVESRLDGDALVLSVRDNGAGLATGSSAGTGVGLRNSRERLAAMYGGSARLTVGPAAGGGTEAVVEIGCARSVAHSVSIAAPD